MFENPTRGRQARNFTTNLPKVLDLKSSSEQIFSKKLTLGAPEIIIIIHIKKNNKAGQIATKKGVLKYVKFSHFSIFH